MTTTSYPDLLDSYEPHLDGRGPDWLSQLRRSAIDRFRELGFPTLRHEEWKYTSLKPLRATALVPADELSSDITQAQLAALNVPSDGAATLVFLDGHFSESLSTFESLAKTCRVGHLAELLEREPGRVRPFLEREIGDEAHPFAAANAAFVQDGLFVEVPGSAVVEAPIHLVFVATARRTSTVAHARNVIVTGPNSQLTLVETYVSLATVPYLTNVVTELVVGENATVNHYKLQQESTDAFHIYKLIVRQARNSTYASRSFSVGGALVRNDFWASLDGEGADCTLDGLYLGKGSQHVDNHTAIDHRQPHCNSHQLYKGILDENATGVFNGKIYVRPDAQKTNADQSNQNLLLSENATINTKPQLEIWADDVRCTHGATVGQLDETALFYVRARGLSLKSAKSLLTYAFANEVIDQVDVPSLQESLRQTLAAWLKHDQPTEDGE